MSNNITYLLGAGASFNSCPIWKEQGEKMIELSTKYLSIPDVNFQEKKPVNLTEQQDILWDIGYFGNKAIEFETIDTYAKKLYINDNYNSELQRLKLSVSVFFTLWESSDESIKNRNGIPFKYIDSRYISLLVSILEKTDGNDPRLKGNIRFVTWNYDLQLERTFKAFCLNHLDWEYVSKNLSFRVNSDNNRELEVCHLNGYNGFYYLPDKSDKVKKEIEFLERSPSSKISEILEEIGFTTTEIRRGQIRINDHINFAWENNPLSKYTREQAIKIFSQTDILVIIGYSFPPFNKEIDSLLFEQLKNRKTKIYYQDPFASDDLLKILTNGFDTQIFPVRDKNDHFILPYEF
jgi:hypothetical protein